MLCKQICRRPDGSVGMALVCQRCETAGGGSNPCWSTRESQVRPAERQRAPTTKMQADLRPCSLNMNVNLYLFLFVRPKSGCCCKKLTLSGFNRYAPRFPQQETKSSTKLLAPPDPILGLENFLKTDFAQKGLPSCPSAIKPQSLIETKTLRFCNPNAKNLRK